MAILKELCLTFLVGALIGGGVILVNALIGLPIPSPHNRPVFLIGTVLLSLCFRLLKIVREGGEGAASTPER